MNNQSIWELKNQKKNILEISEDEVDLIIIGGGITGLMLSYFLKDSKKKIMLVDKGKLGYGATVRTTAKISYVQGDIYSKLKKQFHEQVSHLYYQSQKEAIQLLTTIVEKEKIDCDFLEVPFILFALEEKNRKKIEAESQLLKKFGEKVSFLDEEKVSSAIKVSNTYVFHPLKFLEEIKKIVEKKVSIYEDTLVTSISKEKNFFFVHMGEKKIKAKQVAITCHYPFFLYPTFIPFKTYVNREYVNVGKYKKEEPYSAINVDQSLHSIRFYQDFLIYDSNKHKLTDKMNYGVQAEKSKEDYQQYFGEISYHFMNQDVVSHDYLPFIGRASKKDPHLYLSTAYGGWGMTNGVIGAKILADQIENKQNPYSHLFAPTRWNFPLFFKSCFGMFHYLKGYLFALFKKNNPSYVKISGISYAIHKDKEGTIHKVSLICPHMKCPLVFNQEEKTWDCPCHGSRFTMDGKLLEAPSKKNITKEV